MIAPAAASALQRLLQDDTRFRRTAKGLARSLVWREGVPPPELGEHFGSVLTQHLLAQSDRALLASFWLIESANGEQVAIGRTGLQRAAEAYESLLSNGDPVDPRRALNRILAAASYHLSRYAASAYLLLRTVPAGADAADTRPWNLQMAEGRINQRYFPLCAIPSRASCIGSRSEDVLLERCARWTARRWPKWSSLSAGQVRPSRTSR